MRNSSEGRDRDTFASLAHGVSRDRFVRFKTNISTNYWTQNRMQTYHLVRLIYFQCFPCFNQPGQPFVYHPRTKLSTKKSECLHTQPCCLSTARCPYSDFLNKMIGRSLMAKKKFILNDFLNNLMPFFNLNEIKLDLDNLSLIKCESYSRLIEIRGSNCKRSLSWAKSIDHMMVAPRERNSGNVRK